MKIFLLVNDSPGGAEQVVKEVVKFYLSKGEAIELLFFTAKKTTYWDDLKYSSKLTIKYFDKSIPSLIKHLRQKSKIEFLFTTHIYLTGFVGLLKKLKIINVLSFVGRESTSVFGRYNGIKLFSYITTYWLGYSHLNLLICQTELMRAKLVQNLPKLMKNINLQVIPNPFVKQAVTSLTEVQKLQSLYGKFIVSAGRLIPEKGFDILINAFSNLKKKYPDLKLLILGEGDERYKLLQLAETLGLASDVHLLGFQKQVYPYFKAAYLCVVSSRLEGFPNVLLQMMSQNTKVVSTICAGGIKDINGINLAEPNDVKSLYAAMAFSMIEQNNDKSMLFEAELNERSIDNFIQKLEMGLAHEKN